MNIETTHVDRMEKTCGATLYRFLYIYRRASESDKEKLRECMPQICSADLDMLKWKWEDTADIAEAQSRELLKIISTHHYDAVLCRGSMEQRLRELKPAIDIPIVPLHFLSSTTINMMTRVLEEHPEEFDKDALKVWVLSRQPVYVDDYVMQMLFHARVENVIIGKTVDAAFLQSVIDEKVDFLLCGVGVRNKAVQYGIHAYYNPDVDEKETIINALRYTEELVRSLRDKQEYSRIIEEIMDYSFEALLRIDVSGKIIYMNAEMNRLLEKTPDLVYGRRLWEILPELDRETVLHVLNKQEKLYGSLVEVREREPAVANLIPMVQNGESLGATLYLYQKEKLESLDSRLNQRNREKGHYARYHFDDILGNSSVMETCRYRARQFARHRANVLILGESGTGKELFAQSIHNYSLRKDCPFVAINCGAIPESLLESELFGYVGGAFTGASSKGKKGLIEQANNGTIFLDEIGEMSPGGQVRLLRVLEEHIISRIGDDRQIPVDVRIIAATNRNLYQAVQEGRFREDLYYRLNVLTLHIPPLREREGDISLLAESFMERYSRQNDKTVKLDPEGTEVLQEYDWPGNVRQLRNFCERLAIISDRPLISRAMLTAQLSELRMPEMAAGKEDACHAAAVMKQDHGDMAQEAESFSARERQEIMDLLLRFHGNRQKTADALGCTRATLWRKIKKYGI